MVINYKDVSRKWDGRILEDTSTNVHGHLVFGKMQRGLMAAVMGLYSSPPPPLTNVTECKSPKGCNIYKKNIMSRH